MNVAPERPYLLCKHCFQSTPLPPATHPDRYKGQGSWPMDGLPRNFACHRCMHVYEYSAHEVHPSQPRKAGEAKPLERQTVVCIDMPCDAGNCASQLRIRIVLEIENVSTLDPTVTGALAPGHAIRCDIGHTQKDGMRQAGGVSAMLDPDWRVPMEKDA
jgi:hypothetical protein